MALCFRGRVMCRWWARMRGIRLRFHRRSGGLVAAAGVDGAPGAAGANGAPGAMGPSGPSGNAATVQVGTVVTAAAGTSASVVNTGTASAAVLNFTIPQGAQGVPGSGGGTAGEHERGDVCDDVPPGELLDAVLLGEQYEPEPGGECDGALVGAERMHGDEAGGVLAARRRRLR